MKRYLIATAFALGVGALIVACDDDPFDPNAPGRITLKIVSREAAVAAQRSRTDATNLPRTVGSDPENEDAGVVPSREPRQVQDERPEGDERDAAEAPRVVGRNADDLSANIPSPTLDIAGHLESATARAIGPTNKQISLALSGGFFEGTITGLAAGTYTVVVEGLVGGEVDHFGMTGAVQVQAGQNTTATISFDSFRPNLLVSTPTTAFRFTVNFSSVPNADSYEIEWDTDPAFPSPSSTTTTSTNPTVSVADLDAYHIRGRAVNSFVSGGGRASDVQMVGVVSDLIPTGDDAGTAPGLGFGDRANGTYTQVNIAPFGDEDWYSISACGGDVLAVETFAERLSPLSDLDTYVRIFEGDGTTLVDENDDAIGLDSRVSPTLPKQGTYFVVVSAAGDATVGHYDMAIDLLRGSSNTGVDCSGGAPTDLVFTSEPGTVDRGAPFTVDVQIQDGLGNLVPIAVNTVTLDFSNNVGSVILRGADGFPATFTRIDPVTPEELPGFTNGVGDEVTAMTYNASTGAVLVADLNDDLYSVDPVGGAETFIGNMLLTIKGLAFEMGGAGRLLGVERAANMVWDINPTNALATPVGPIAGVAPVGFNGLATDPTTGTMYAVARLVMGPGPAAQVRELISFNPATLVGSTVDTLTQGGVAGIAFTADGTLFAVTGDGADHNEVLWKVDKATAEMTRFLGLAKGLCCGETIAAIPAHLGGALTVMAVGGVATFNNLDIDAPGTSYTLAATSSGLMDGFSGSIDVNPGTFTAGPAAGVDVNPAGASITTVGGTQTFKADAFDGLGSPVSGVTWSSLNGNLATVDPGTGVATAQEVGQVNVEAQVDGVSGYGLLTITMPPSASINYWSHMSSPTSQTLYSVWGTSESEQVAVGASGTILYYDGTSWTEEMSSPTTSLLTSVWGTSSNNVVAVGDLGTILYFDGSTWTQEASSPTSNILYRVWGSSPDDIFAVGAGGTIIHYDGGTWTTQTTPTAELLVGVWGTSPSDVIAVGTNGAILYYDGSSWTLEGSSPTTDNIYSLWGPGPIDVTAVGFPGTILYYDGSTWTQEMSSPTGNFLWTDWGSWTDEILAVGNAGTIIEYNGSSWSIEPTPTSQALRGIWGTALGGVFAVGAGGTILRGSRDPISVLAVGATTGNEATTDIFTAGDLAGSVTVITDAATFNAMTPTDLRNNYDAIVFRCCVADAMINADWTTRLVPFMSMGGGVIFEDIANALDLAPGVTAVVSNTLGPFSITSTVAGLTDGITNDFNNSHMFFTAWDPALSAFIQDGTPNTIGLYGSVSGGCFLVTGPDNDWHGLKGGSAADNNQYNLLINEIRWVLGCPR